MNPSYHTHPDLTRMHQADIMAEREGIRQAKLAAAASNPNAELRPSPWARLAGSVARLPRQILHPRSSRLRPGFRNAPEPRG
jgi:hypothetical protein